MRDLRKNMVMIILRFSLVGLLVVAGVGKLLDARGAGVLANAMGDGFVTRVVWNAMEMAAPWIEVATALMLLGGKARGVGAILAIALGFGFGYVAVALPDGVKCRCLGIVGGFDDRVTHVAVAIVVVACGVVLLIEHWKIRQQI